MPTPLVVLWISLCVLWLNPIPPVTLTVGMATVTMTTTHILPLPPCRPDVGGAYLTEPVPLRIQEKGLVVLIVNCKVKHQVNDGGYESRRDRCYEAAKIMNRRSLREATEDDIQGTYRLNPLERHVERDLSFVDNLLSLKIKILI